MLVTYEGPVKQEAKLGQRVVKLCLTRGCGGQCVDEESKFCKVCYSIDSYKITNKDLNAFQLG